MRKVHSILVIVDPTAREHPSIQKAERLAKRFDARVELYVCETQAARQERLSAERGTDPESILESLAMPLRDRGLDVCLACEFADSLAEGLMDRARRTCADLIVKDTHHHSLLHRTLLSNTDWQLIRSCPVPLLLTKVTSWSSSPTVLAAVDPGHLNDKPAILDREILSWSRAVAARLEATLHAVHVYVPLTIAATSGGVVAPMANTLTSEALAFEDKRKNEELRALTDTFEIPRDNVHLDLGVPGELLPRKAHELNADIVVMGAIARSGLAKVFIGSTAERVLEKLPCDALIVKPPNFAEALPG